MTQDKFRYPKFIIFELEDNGPRVTTFETAREVTTHLMARDLDHCAVFKDRKLVHFRSSELTDIEKQLEQE